MTHSTKPYGQGAYADVGEGKISAGLPIEFQVYSIESVSLPVEFQITDVVLDVSLPVSFQVYTIDAVQLPVQFQIVSGDVVVSLPVSFEIEGYVIRSEIYVEFRRWADEQVSLPVQFQISYPTYSVELPVRFDIFDLHAPSKTVQFNIFDTSLSSPSHDTWSIRLTVGGVDYSNQLVDTLSVSLEVDSSAVAFFSIVPVAGSVNLLQFVGLPVSIQYTNQSGTYQMYTGYVDKPTYQPDDRQVSFSCTNDLQKRIAGLNREEIQRIVPGIWSPVIFDENADNWRYANDLLSTVRGSMWIDVNGILRYTDWQTAAVDYEFTDAEKVTATERVINADKRNVINRVETLIDFRYERMVQRNVSFDSRYGQPLCHYLDSNIFRIPTRDEFLRAAQSTGWDLLGLPSYDPVWEPEDKTNFTVNCNGRTIGWTFGKDIDPEGFCIGAKFSLAKRWTKTLTETAVLVVEAPKSVEANGVVGVREEYGLQAQSEPDTWETDKSPFEAVSDVEGQVANVGFSALMPLGSEVLENGDWVYDATEAETTGRTEFDNAQRVALEKAKTEILAGHREKIVELDIALFPLVDLSNTVRFNLATGKHTGKVAQIIHNVSFSSGQATTTIGIAVSGVAAVGSVSDTPLDPIEVPVDYPLTQYDTHVFLPWYIGGRSSSPPLDPNWVGYFSNYVWDPFDSSRPDPDHPWNSLARINPEVNMYPEQFTVQVPDISAEDRRSLTMQAEQNFIVDIPIDESEESVP